MGQSTDVVPAILIFKNTAHIPKTVICMGLRDIDEYHIINT